MSRNLTAGMVTEVQADNVRPILLFEGVMESGTVYYWTGYGNLSWNAQTWVGTGSLIEVSNVDETDDIKAQGTGVRVKGVDPTMVSLALQSVASGKAGIIRLALLNSSGAIIADPKILFKGRLDGAEIDDSNYEDPFINLQYEHELVDLERPREWRYTDEHQRKLYPGDTGLRYMTSLQDKVLYWGRR